MRIVILFRALSWWFAVIRFKFMSHGMSEENRADEGHMNKNEAPEVCSESLDTAPARIERQFPAWMRLAVLAFSIAVVMLLASVLSSNAQECSGTIGPDGFGCAFEPVVPENNGVLSMIIASYGVSLYNMASGAEGVCILCSFTQFFTSAMGDVSYAVFQYFRAGFVILTPVFMALWIGTKVWFMMLLGGEGGPQVIVAIVKRFAYFAFIWMIIGSNILAGSVSAPHRAWNFSGPLLITEAFSMAEEIRKSVMTVAPSGADSFGRFSCSETFLEPYTKETGMAIKSSHLLAISRAVCGIEKIHMVGIATSMVIMGSSPGVSPSWYEVTEIILLLVQMVVNFFAGAIMAIAYAMSAVWFTFLVTDIVVRALITAAFLPVFFGISLFDQLRSYSFSALKGMISAFVSAIAIGITGAVAIFVISSVGRVYQVMIKVTGPVFLPDGAIPFQIVGTRNLLGQFLTGAAQNSGATNGFIPMNLATPWFMYLLLASVAVLAMGKKLVGIIESILGQQSSSMMADTSTQVVGGAARMALAGAQVAALAAPGVGSALLKAGSMAAGAGSGSLSTVGGAAISKISSAVNPMSSEASARENSPE